MFKTNRSGIAFSVTLLNTVMISLEFKELVEVSTPKGDGLIWYMIDYGPHSDTLYTIIIKETGECWQMCHKDFRIKQNISIGIGGKYDTLDSRKEEPPVLNNK